MSSLHVLLAFKGLKEHTHSLGLRFRKVIRIYGNDQRKLSRNFGSCEQLNSSAWVAESKGSRCGTVWEFECKELCESLRLLGKCERARLWKLVLWDAVCQVFSARFWRSAACNAGHNMPNISLEKFLGGSSSVAWHAEKSTEIVKRF